MIRAIAEKLFCRVIFFAS